MTGPAPTQLEIDNAAARAEIAERFRREYDQCSTWAAELFGTGWEPRHRHFLIDKDEEDQARRTGTRPVAAATVYTVRNDAGERRHFSLVGGKPVECADYKEAFGPMLLEPHPTQRIEVRGEMVAPHRYSLCWAPIETYRPKSAEQLAAARERRLEKAVEKAAEDAPLFAEQIRSGELPVKERKARNRQ